MSQATLYRQIRFAATVLVAMGLATGSNAQYGANDPSFNVNDDFAEETGADDVVLTALQQPDGKMLIAGEFASFNGVPCSRVTRLLADGSVDGTFSVPPVVGSKVTALALQPDGKIILAGEFTSIDGIVANRIARLETTGALDLTFSSGAGPNALVDNLALQPDGKVLLVGAFTTVQGFSRGRIARLESNGALDTSFDPGVGADGAVRALNIRSDGRIVIAGAFSEFNGAALRSVARLNSDGSVDATFDPGLGVFGPSGVLSLAAQPDGKLVLGGLFTHVNNTVRNCIARLHPDGALDTSFKPGSGPTQSPNVQGFITSMDLQPDGRILVAGLFNSFGGTPRPHLARLNSDGSVDTSFDSGGGPNGPSGPGSPVYVVKLRSDGRALVGGSFIDFAARRRLRCAQVHVDGQLDSSFTPTMGVNGEVMTIASLASGRALIGGEFTTYNDTVRRRIVRIDADGELDPSFDPGLGANATMRAIALQTDGKILIGGQFTTFDGVAVGRIARLHTDGTLDPTFAPGAGASGTVSSIAIRDDGRILVGGFFNDFHGVARPRIVSLLPSGALDPSFQYGSGPDAGVTDIRLYPDGRALLAGPTQYDGFASNGLIRLHPTGAVDTGFVAQFSQNKVEDFQILGDGRVLACGGFLSYAGASRRGVVRIGSDGTLDPSFDPGAGMSDPSVPSVLALALQSNGDTLLGGDFEAFDGIARSGLVRLTSNGAVDTSFDPGAGASDYPWVRAIAIQADGKALIGGGFQYYDQALRHRIARVFAQDMQGVSYCTAGTSTNGCTAHITGVGDPSATASSGFTLHVSGVEGAKQGLIYYGVSGRTGSTWGAGGTSFQCVKPPTQRTGAQGSGGAAGQCDGAFATDWLAYIAAHPSALGTPLTVGAVVNAQAWYRDPPAVKTTNLSDALEFVIAP